MSDLPSLSSGPVGSRFVSQNDIDHARARRDEQWKAAYARLGQEPPPQPKEDAYDGRSLAEKLAANRAAKQEEWEEKNKLANQFRALEEDEIMFLDSVRERQEQAERDRKLRDGEELKSFREAVANKVIVKSPPPAPTSSKDKEAAAAPPSASSSSGSKPTTVTPTPAPPVTKKAAKPSLKGVLVKKKTKDTSKPAPKSTSKEESGEKRDGGRGEEDGAPDPKRRKVSSA